jgi:lipoate-protein ligase A
MTAVLRIIDTGLRSARWNVAATAALTDMHSTGRMADVLRFHRYPKCVLIGRNQALDQAVRFEACRNDGVEVARRVTGGGSVYMAPGALAWDLIVSRRRVALDIGEAARTIGEAVAAGLERLGVAARYRAENEIVVNERKLCGMSGYFEGETVAYQGTILIDTDLNDMARYLRLPFTSRDSRSHLSARLTTLSERLGRIAETGEVQSAIVMGLTRGLRCKPAHETMSVEELALADAVHDGIYGRDDFAIAGPDVAFDRAYAEFCPQSTHAGVP